MKRFSETVRGKRRWGNVTVNRVQGEYVSRKRETRGREYLDSEGSSGDRVQSEAWVVCVCLSLDVSFSPKKDETGTRSRNDPLTAKPNTELTGYSHFLRH